MNKGKKRGQELLLRLTSGLNVQGLQGYDYEFVYRAFCLITNEHNVEKRKRGSFVIKKHTGSLFSLITFNHAYISLHSLHCIKLTKLNKEQELITHKDKRI